MSKGYIYIMINPALHDMVKIGFATDVDERRKQLSTTALPYEYEVYATYETSGSIEDKKLHSIIDRLNPSLRLSKNREFFSMSAQEAYRLLESIAIISGTVDKLQLAQGKSLSVNLVQNVSGSTCNTQKKIQNRQSREIVKFSKCGIPIGAELVYIDDDSIRAVVYNDRKVLFNGEVTSLSAIVGKIKNKQAVQGTRYFKYNGRVITDIAEETQWKSDAP